MNKLFLILHRNNKTRPRRARGFTLIELLVAVGLFSTVMAMSAGIILSIVGGNKKAQQINAVANNLNFAVESLVRDLKTGYDYYCTDTLNQVKVRGIDATGRGCVAGVHDTIQFVSTITGNERVVSYRYANDSTTGTGYLAKRVCSILGTAVQDCSNYTRVTSPDIDLKEVSFYVKAPKEGDDDQPGVLIVIRGTSRLERNVASDFHIQTYVSQRLLNI